jgi:hypothetical protein
VVLDTLKFDGPSLDHYRILLKALLVDQVPITEDNWRTLQKRFTAVARALCSGATDPKRGSKLLEWVSHEAVKDVGTPAPQTDSEPNVCRVADGKRFVDIRLGSIHSVKGQTHLATLVLSTYWYYHSSKRILPWLLGDKVNRDGANDRDSQRLLQTYVAMTRPSHMICLAVPRRVFGEADDLARQFAILGGRGWRVAEILEGLPVWRV